MDALEPVIEHLQNHLAAYVGGGVVALVIVAVFRRLAVPILAKLLELAVYFAAMHAVVGTFVRVVNWFKGATAMKALKQNDLEAAPGWTTPYLEFWDRSQYFPSWLPYVEIGLAIAITAVVWHFRPVYFRPKEARKPASKGMPASKSHMSGSPLSKSMADKAAPYKSRQKGSRRGKGKRRR